MVIATGRTALAAACSIAGVDDTSEKNQRFPVFTENFSDVYSAGLKAAGKFISFCLVKRLISNYFRYKNWTNA